MRELLRVGALELCWLEAHGEPIVALYNTVWGGRVYFYQGGRRPDLPGKIRPEVVLHARMVREAIESGHSE